MRAGLLPCALLLAGALLADRAARGSAGILIYSPSGERPALGAVEFHVEVLDGEGVGEVILRVDGDERGRLRAPPYRLVVDVGQDNVEHRFEAEVRRNDGTRVTAVRETPRIHIDEEIDLELQQLYVTVSRRVLDLGEDDFRVLDDGAEQTLVTFETGDVPPTVALLVDASDSMRGERLHSAVAGARAFVASMAPFDEAMLVLFSDRLLHRAPFASREKPFDAPLASLRAAGGSAISDALYFAVRTVEARAGRRVVVLLSDGVDVESALSMDDILWTLRQSNSLLYWIRLLDEHDPSAERFSSWRGPADHRRQVQQLEDAVLETGGRIVAIADATQAEIAFGEIVRELREQYVLGYYPSADRDDGRFHRVNVQVPGNAAGDLESDEPGRQTMVSDFVWPMAGPRRRAAAGARLASVSSVFFSAVKHGTGPACSGVERLDALGRRSHGRWGGVLHF